MPNLNTYFDFRLEGQNIPEDILASGGAAGIDTTEVVVEVPEEDPDLAQEREEAERQKRRQSYITSQSDRWEVILQKCKLFITYNLSGYA